MNAIIWVLITGALWCALPEEYVLWHTIYNNFRKWSQQGIMEKIFEYFTSNAEQALEIQIDATYIKTHQNI